MSPRTFLNAFFGRIFTVGSKALLQSPSPSQGLGDSAVGPHCLLFQAPVIIPFPHTILESWLFLHCPMRLFDWLLLIIIAFQNPDSCPHSCNFLFPLIGKTSSGKWGIFIESIFGDDYFVNRQDEAYSREVTHWKPPHVQVPGLSPSSQGDQQISRDPCVEMKGHAREGPFRSI